MVTFFPALSEKNPSADEISVDAGSSVSDGAEDVSVYVNVSGCYSDESAAYDASERSSECECVWWGESDGNARCGVVSAVKSSGVCDADDYAVGSGVSVYEYISAVSAVRVDEESVVSS